MPRVRYIIRPLNIRTTPRLLKEALEARRTVAFPFQQNNFRPSIEKDFFLTYPPVEETEEYAQSISNTSRRNSLVSRTNNNSRSRSQSGQMELLERSSRSMANYSLVRNFFTKNKPQQRSTLWEYGFSTPFTIYGTNSFGQLDNRTNRLCTFVSRPIRHRGGSGWNIISERSSEEILQRPDQITTQGSEYIQQVLPKDYEYRIIVCRGEPIITLLKRNINNLSPLEPWNHQQGSSFVTVENIENNRLRRTNIYTKIAECDLLKHIDLCALDVIYLKNPARYFLLELNFCPGLTIEANIEKVRSHVL